MYLLVARYYIIRALVTPPGETNARKKWGYMQKQQSKTKKKHHANAGDKYTHTHTHIYMCVYMCVYIYMCVCAYKYKLIYELVLEEVTFYRTQS